ncbi:MAG: tetratricopeptide repeat protein [Candidatus Pacebacteria bacterium]|nr:tetratricopeptide repeat protein [Candidatus Paceibacterota bacterium]
MKKTLIIFLIVILAVFIYLGGKFLNSNKVQENNNFSELEEILNATSTAPQAEIKEIKEDFENTFTPYRGQDLSEIGNDAFIEKVPEKILNDSKAELARLKSSLEKNPENVDEWIKVGMIKKFYNNYIGARDAWEYAKYLNDTNSSVYYNLGNLYGMYLKNNVEGEENFKRALELEKGETSFYINFADFYRNFYIEKKAEAEAVIQEGLKNMPNDGSLLVYAGGYYEELGDKEKALLYYKKALDLDPDNQELKNEIEKLSVN